MVLGALAALLEIESDIRVVGQAQDGREALRLTLKHRPDVLLADIEMPEMSRLEVAAELKARKAATGVIILTTFARPGYLRRALETGQWIPSWPPRAPPARRSGRDCICPRAPRAGRAGCRRQEPAMRNRPTSTPATTSVHRSPSGEV